MINMALINMSGLRKEVMKLGARVGGGALAEIAGFEEERICSDIARFVRSARISGRKTLKKEDIVKS